MRREVINMLLYGVPLCMAVGLCLKEYTNSLKEEDAIVNKRVLQALGEWVPPLLSLEERRALEQEKRDITAELAKIDVRMAEAARKKQEMYTRSTAGPTQMR